MGTDTVVIPEKFADKIRRMSVNDKIDITDKGRAPALNQAKYSFPVASFVTRQHEGKIYLIRTA